jgi:Big-like domain-containing protein
VRGRRQGGEATQRLRIGFRLLCRCAAVPLLTLSCARIAPPPGGPPDAIAPGLVATRPDSVGVYPGFEGDAEFVFDETVSEGGQANMGTGSGDLERLIVLSPSDKVPRVGWERSRITVRPRDGWRPNTVYRIELLPGVADLRRNRSRAGQVITFTTGAPLPTDSLSGYVIDWTTRQPARLAVVEAILLPDSLAYRTQSDSSGKFTLAPLPHGSYLLRGFIDQNKDRLLSGRETWDTVAAAPAPSATGVLWLALRDTLAPRIMTITVRDSLTLELHLTQPIDPTQSLDSLNVRVLQLPDSAPVAVRSFLPKALDDSLTARAKAVADSLKADSTARARPDSAGATPRPTPPTQPARQDRRGAPQAPVDSTVIKLALTRSALSDRLILRLATPLAPEASYAVQTRALRNLNRAGGDALLGFKAPKAATVADSTKVDSAATDSLKPRKPSPRIP